MREYTDYEHTEESQTDFWTNELDQNQDSMGSGNPTGYTG